MDPITTHLTHSRSHLYVWSVILTFVLFGLVPYSATRAAPACDLTRDLDIGMEGKDVLCLQQWLNAEGYTLTESGPGAPGFETERFGALTRDALARFQKDRALAPALGFLGPKTRLLIVSVPGKTVTPALPPESAVATAPKTQVSDVQSAATANMSDADRARTEMLLSLLESKGLVGSVRDDAEEEEDDEDGDVGDGFEERVMAAIEMLRNAEAKIKKGTVSAEQLTVARNNFEDARDDLFDAVYAYFKGKTDKADELIDDAENNAEDAFRDAGGVTRDDEMEDRIDSIDDAIDDAWDELDEREDAGDDTDDAEELLTEAEELLQEAEDAFDEDDLDRAEDLLDDIEDMIDEALDAVQSEGESDAENAIERAQDAIDDAQDAIDDAEDEGDDTDDSRDLLDDAEDLLSDAEDAYDDEEYDDAVKLAKKAEDRADSAVDAL